MTDDVFKQIMNSSYGAYGQHDVGAVYISTARSGGKTAFQKEWEKYIKEREMNCNEKLKNYLCTRCKYKHNSMVPCTSCDGVSEFVEQSRSKYKDGLNQHVYAQKYIEELLHKEEKEKEMSKVSYHVNSAGITYCPTIRHGECEIMVPIEIIDDRAGELFISKREFAVHLENLLNGNECGYAIPKIIPKIKNVIFNEPATIVFWADDTKTVVKCQDGDIFDPEKGLTMAITKKALGNNYEWYNTIKKYTKRYYKQEKMAKLTRFRSENPDLYDSLTKAAEVFDASMTKVKKEESDGK